MIDAAVAAWREREGGDSLPPAFVAAEDLTIGAHLAMQAALQPFVDNAVSKTVTVAQACPFETFAQAYELAYELGLKGCTLYRPNPLTGAVLRPERTAKSFG